MGVAGVASVPPSAVEGGHGGWCDGSGTVGDGMEALLREEARDVWVESELDMSEHGVGSRVGWWCWGDFRTDAVPTVFAWCLTPNGKSIFARKIWR